MFTPQQISSMIAEYGENPLKLLHALGGYYECPFDADRKRLGPLVGYAGKYNAGDGKKLQYVGDVYANFSVAEQFPAVMEHYATQLLVKNSSITSEVDIVCGPQMGGISIGYMLALVANKRFAYIEKKITQLATEELREQAILQLLRHIICGGERVLVVEDVLNNFSTTSETIDVVHQAGGIVVGIAGLLNRSLAIEGFYEHKGNKIPIMPLVRKPIDEWRQDAPQVLEDMRKGNVVLKPKNDWQRLMQAMLQAA